MSALPEGLEQSFAVAAGELGMCGAGWLFAKTVAHSGGDEAVAQLRDALGRSFPVLDAVGERWLAGDRFSVEPSGVAAALGGVTDLVVVGLEALHLDALLERLGPVRCALLRHSPFEVDWERVAANYGGQVELVEMDDFQRRAGPRSALLTFAYGVQGGSTHVMPGWLRVTGEDVRTQFRSLVAWDVLRSPMFVYPRWLVEVGTDAFTEVL